MLPHTADVGIAASADSLTGLFSEAVRGLAAIMLDEDPPSPSGELAPVEVTGDDHGALLAALLTEALWLMESELAVAVSASLEIEGERARGWFDVVRGVELRGPQIKAVTYHQLRVEHTESGWRATIYLDV